MEIPSYVSDGSVRKYNRALVQIAVVNAARKVKGEEELDVKGLYALYGGLVLDEQQVEEVDEKPARRARK